MGTIAGLDWAADKHDVCIADEHGRVLAEHVVDHDEAGISGLVDLLLEQQVERVAIERPDGLLVGRLLAAGLTVLAILPTRSRPPASAFGPRRARATASKRWSCASSRAPTRTASPR
jgi:hypothetical protein